MSNLRRQGTFPDSDYESCPVGGEWWTCTDANYPTFIGCCSSDPCSGSLCSGSDLYPMGFGSITTPAPDYPNHSCPYGGLWYTCADNTTPFQGCCNSNPCNGVGCPASDLRPAGVHTVLLVGGTTFTVPASMATGSQATSSASASSSTSTSTITGTPTSVTTATALPAVAAKSSHTGAIAGGATAGGVLILALLVLILYFCGLRRKRQASLSEISPSMITSTGNASASNARQTQNQMSEYKGFYKDSPEMDYAPTPVPLYQSPHQYKPHNPSRSLSPNPIPLPSPTPPYIAYGSQPIQAQPQAQEIAGLGLSPAEYHRSMARQFQVPTAELESPRSRASYGSNYTSRRDGLESPDLRSEMSGS